VNAAKAFCVNRRKGSTRIAIKEAPTLGRYTAAVFGDRGQQLSASHRRFRKRGLPMLPQEPERELVGRTIAAMLMAQQIKHTGQVHPETLLTELGALAGFAVQMSIRKSVIERQKLDPDTILVEVATKNNEIYYFSDLLNWMLFENMEHPPFSVWAYVRAAVPPTHHLLLPDISEIVSNAARSIGTSRFGVPRLPREHMPHRLPREALELHWRFICAELEARDPSQWPYDVAAAAQWQMVTGRDTIEPSFAARIVMEAAIPMSKVDPRTIIGA
jgi:hypothetical protein